MTTLRLYHWTCEHGATDIRADGMLVRPNMGQSWWTDLDRPGERTRRALCLTSHTLRCDRMAYRCEADSTAGIEHWPEHRHLLHPDWVANLEAAEGSKPAHWWIALSPVQVRSIRRTDVIR